MKKNKLALTALLLSGALFLNSCVGSFSLFNRLSSWNRTVSDDKFVNELVFLSLTIIPVYLVAGVADALVLNSIEFWTGSNPLANAGEVKRVKGENGYYLVETLPNGYTITKEGESTSMNLIYNQEENTWNLVTNGESTRLLRVNDNGTADLFLPDGKHMNVTLNDQGLMAARQAIAGSLLMVAR